MGEPGYALPVRRAQVFVQFAAARRWDVDYLLHSAGVSRALLAEGRSGITCDQFSQLIRQLWKRTDDELFGLGAAPVPPGTFRMLGYALLSGSPTLGQLLARLEEFHRATPGIPPLTLRVSGDDAKLCIDISAIARPLDLVIDILLAATHRILSWAIRQRLPLRQVGVPYSRPAGVDNYDAMFGAPVTFRAPSPLLVFDATMLTAPIMRSPAECDEFIRNAPAELVARRNYGVSMSDRVRRVLQRSASNTRPTADDVANHLAMSTQTLRRRLHDEQTSLSRIREEILRDAAITSLASGEETVAALSARLGFSEPSAFTRAFRRWTGQPPGTYRLSNC